MNFETVNPMGVFFTSVGMPALAFGLKSNVPVSFPVRFDELNSTFFVLATWC